MCARILRNGRVLLADGGFAETDLLLAAGRIAGIGAGIRCEGAAVTDLDGLLLLPGIVDLHGDAFERQIMPRPGVTFPLDMALLDTDRQLIANGITTAFYGVTYSWEPGLRGREAAFAFMAAFDRLRPQMLSDARVHLRHEVHNVEGEADVLNWMAAGRISLVAFNDHLDMITGHLAVPEKLGRYAGRSGLSPADFLELVESVGRRSGEVPDSVARLAAAARERGIAMASHDDDTPAVHHHYADLGCRLCEFPLNLATAETATARGNAVVAGAPNVVRGGSHTHGPSAAELVGRGLAQVLTSDYYYPSLLQAAFRLAARGIVPLAEAWALVSTNPARMVGLEDRGILAEGKRADLVVVDAEGALPRLVGVYARGVPVFTAEARLAA